MSGRHANRLRTTRRRRSGGFTLIELLIALAITASLLSAMLLALHAAFRGYQASVEQSSTHITARVASQRILALVRTGSTFGPLPADPRDATLRTDEFDVAAEGGATLSFRLDRGERTLFVRAGDGPERTLLSGVDGPVDAAGAAVGAFTLEFEKGTKLTRASFDFTVAGDPEAQLAIEGDEVTPLRVIGSASPRRLAALPGTFDAP